MSGLCGRAFTRACVRTHVCALTPSIPRSVNPSIPQPLTPSRPHSLTPSLPPLFLCAALSAADRGGFKTVRQLMDPVIEEMQEAAAGEDDGMLIKAVGRLVFG